ncbi:MAG: lysylphosphatidylglycerol synthase transmembrane domain-containing protein [Psychroflexus sp.]|nr:lysylphosphatidylglycerol synthase transmembrane domain-containing protein [Psychroflexus sp.]
MKLKKFTNFPKPIKFYLKLIIKIVFTLAALYVVEQKVDVSQLKEIIFQEITIYLLLAFILFNLSQLISVFRLKLILNSINIKVKYFDNARIYYKSMFYNLFLPGGIGGDGFKYFTFKKKYDIVTKKLIIHLLADRFFGLFAIFLIILILGFFILPQTIFPVNRWFLLLLLPVALPIFYLMINKFTSTYDHFLKLNIVSLAIQICQGLSALSLLYHINFDNNASTYIFLFFIASIASVIPISFGGFGAREAVFIYSANMFNISAEKGVAIGLLFFLLTAISALIGNFVNVRNFQS